ncbi:UNVERIFIED_CONTAM: Pentatricopeptide repeat-containing protein, mitochondrial [Sesamum calycinum]|uniref:Pentatricopeptide repeat-containing protein, mitochondrial n=1 Tax=Sesamum calycinum TaxID=2727403 RepID=A0AAW2M9T2_9LAMI
MYVKCEDLEEAKELFERMEEKMMVSWATMLIGYVKFGYLDAAWRLFNVMPENDVVPWNAMISAYVQAGHDKETLSLFYEMQAMKVEPDEVTMVFHEILDRNALTYTAIIGGLALHRDAQDALSYFLEMIAVGVTSDEVTFLGVLSACCLGDPQKHRVGRAAMKLLDLDLNDSGIYVLLANMYVEENTGDKAGELRKMMREREVDKTPGCSSIEFNGNLGERLIEPSSSWFPRSFPQDSWSSSASSIGLPTLETAQPEVGSSGWKSTARRVVSGAPPAALENPEDRVPSAPVVLITASGLQGEQPLVDGTISEPVGCRRTARAAPAARAGRRVPAGDDWERLPRGPSPGVEQSTQNCALNVKVKKFNQARVNGGSNYDSLKRNHSQGNGLGGISGEKKTLLSLTLVRLCEMT